MNATTRPDLPALALERAAQAAAGPDFTDADYQVAAGAVRAARDLIESQVLRGLAENARTRMRDGDTDQDTNDDTDTDTVAGYNPTAPVAAYEQGWRDALDSFARHLDRLAHRLDPADDAR